MSLLVILGRFEIHPDDAEQAAALMLTMMNATLQEAGCLHYAYSRDLSVVGRFHLSERWESAEALALHFQAEHMRVYRAGIQQLRVLSRVVQRYEVSGVADL